MVGRELDDNEAVRGVLDDDDPRVEPESEGIAIRTATLIVGGELEPSSAIEILLEFEPKLVPFSADDEARTAVVEL